MLPHQKENIQVRDRSLETGGLLKGDMIPPAEILVAKEISLKDNGFIEHDELVRTIAMLFGYKRVGPDLKAAISKCLSTDI